MATKNEKAPPASREPMLTGGALDLVMVIAAALTVALVGWSFSFDVNRVFDMPKAVALKLGGGGLLVVWLAYGILGPGWPWKSARLFAAPALVLVAVMTASTITSIDPWMSLQGVYERQFGLQGLVSCVGLYLVVSTTLRSRRGAVGALGALAIVGGVIGAYSILQSYGHDPYDFFSKPHNKVYSTLGNATFAGNALALIFPISLILAVVAAAQALAPARWKNSPGNPMSLLATLLVMALVVAALLVLPGWTAAQDAGMTKDARQTYMKLGMGVAVLITIALALIGSWGPATFRAESEGARKLADAALAGALLTFVMCIGAGLAFTRTRGAWVGTGVAIAGGLALLPGVFRDNPALMRRMRVGGVIALVGAVLGVGVILTAMPKALFSRTVLSIPHAFSPEKTVYGQGQGTRRYLWTESPRVLMNHQGTLDRQAGDRADWREKAKGFSRGEETASGLATTARKATVWLLGIGIETYRYAFMSHKSKKLEALDPMTNHDNPHNNYLYILASCGILGLGAYLWLLWRLLSTAWKKFGDAGTRSERALAFGVVTSFFSYAVYSIAGFDSVACSVFLYFLLGAAAVLFEPAEDEPRRSPLIHLAESWRAWRKTPGSGVPIHVTAGVVLLSMLAIQTVYGVTRVHAAESAFVGGGKGRRGDFEGRVDGMKEAIRINPRESFYWQSLGGLYIDAARQFRDAAARSEQQGQADAAKGYRARAESMTKEAEKALYGALDHAWAPENIYISLFQLYYSNQKWEEAERALERALAHSPHLGPVRANLAVLELERGAYQEALDDCQWVLDVEPSNGMALRTCGRAQQKLGALGDARGYLERAKAVMPNDRNVAAFLRELEAAEKPTSTVTPAAPAPATPTSG